MDTVPPYVAVVFILSTFATLAFLTQVVRSTGGRSLAANILFFILPLWLIFQGVIALGGFYQNENSVPPRLALLGVLPTIIFILGYLIFFRKEFVERISLPLLTSIHVVRIPVELTLYWLFVGRQVPQVMTFEGRNFDIASGFLAIVVYFIAFRGRRANRVILIAFNVIGLLLLANIVSIALMALPSPMQQIAFDQPNRAVTVFPYIWLPTVIVPAVLFAHLASLWQLLTGGRQLS